METDNVERDLRSLRRLYSLLETNARNQYIPEAYLSNLTLGSFKSQLDENTKFLLKQLLDSATQQLFVRQSKILAAQLGLPPKADLHNLKPSNVATAAPPALSSQINGSQIMQSGKPLEAKGTFKRDLRVNQIQSNSSNDGLSEEVADAIEQIETQLSALSFCSRRVDSDDRTRSCKSVTTPIEERRQSFGPSMAGLRSNYKMPMPQTSVNSGADVTVRSYDDPILPPDDGYLRIKPRQPLPPRPVRSIAFKEPSQSIRTSQKMLSIMKPTLLDQETETWDEDSSEKESGKTRSWTGSEDDEELVSTEQESEETSGETESSTGSSWETQAENVTESESDSSYPPENDGNDESEASVSPPHKKRDRSSDSAKQRKKAMGRFKRFKNKLGQVFHHHHHHHHHNKNQGSKPSAWKHLQSTFHQKHKEKSRSKPESKGLTTYKQHRGGQFHTLVEGLMRHRRHSKKQKHKLQSHGKKTHWWQTLKKRQGGVKFPNKGQIKLGKKHYLSKKVQEEN